MSSNCNIKICSGNTPKSEIVRWEAMKSKNTTKNVLEWMLEEAPFGIVPQILSFVGSRKLQVLSRLNKEWSRLVLSEETWQTLCADTGKWKVGDPKPQHSWLDLYRNSPCVPIDYDTVESALASISTTNLTPIDEGKRISIRLLLQPAEYVLNDSLVIRTLGSTQISVETLEEFPSKKKENLHREDSVNTVLIDGTAIVNANPGISDFGSISRSSLRGNNRRKAFTFQKLQNHFESAKRILRKSSCLPASFTVSADSIDSHTATMEFQGEHTLLCPIDEGHRLRRAKLILKSPKQNKPLFLVQEGLLHLKNIDLCHYSSGADIWRGNAALQLQPYVEPHLAATVVAIRQPTAVLTNVDIVSHSGRGIVAIDGGKVTAKKCRIHHCAATGLFVSGFASEATVEDCDIVSNGFGNHLSSRGVPPGHSGIFVSTGCVRIIHSNVSHNSLTGVTPAQSNNLSEVHIVTSTLIGNGTTTTTNGTAN